MGRVRLLLVQVVFLDFEDTDGAFYWRVCRVCRVCRV